ncbi:hypothetical protein GJ496_000071 [Pomphorhynchus laevis]|nr:hypothetical protein GJ496_000071 [Pomphorhynchus laevis]
MGSAASLGRERFNAERMAKTGGIPDHEFHQLQSVFIRASRDGRLDLNEFIKFYSSLTGLNRHGIDARTMAMRVFNAIDLDNNRYISLDEFVIAYILLSNTSGLSTNERIERFLLCYFGGYVPERISYKDAENITKSLNILCDVNPLQSSFRPDLLSHQSMHNPFKQHGFQHQQYSHGVHSPFTQQMGGSFTHATSQYYSQSGSVTREEFLNYILSNNAYQSYLRY